MEADRTEFHSSVATAGQEEGMGVSVTSVTHVFEEDALCCVDEPSHTCVWQHPVSF